VSVAYCQQKAEQKIWLCYRCGFLFSFQMFPWKLAACRSASQGTQTTPGCKPLTG
jgi:hypothetical protein